MSGFDIHRLSQKLSVESGRYVSERSLRSSDREEFFEHDCDIYTLRCVRCGLSYRDQIAARRPISCLNPDLRRRLTFTITTEDVE